MSVFSVWLLSVDRFILCSRCCVSCIIYWCMGVWLSVDSMVGVVCCSYLFICCVDFGWVSYWFVFRFRV